MTQTVVLRSDAQRALAKRLIDAAPVDAVVKISPPARSTEQSALMWSLLSDVSRAKPEGRSCTPETWKQLFLHALGFSVAFEHGLNGEPFPVGFRSSRLSKRHMSDLIETIIAYGTEHGVLWTTPEHMR